MIHVANRPHLDLSAAIITSSPNVTPAVANALWPRLKRAHTDPTAWITPKLYIPMRTHAGGNIRTTTPPVPAPDAKYRWEVLYEEVQLYAYASRTQTRIGTALRAKLYKSDHDRLLKMVDGAHRTEYNRALTESVCERPFYRQPELPTGWRRNTRDELITPRVGRVLEELARLAHVEFLTPAVEDALIR